MNVHPAADIFPPMSADEYRALKADISEHGILEAVWTCGNLLLDGRHRWRACSELGIPCPTREYTGTNPLAFVISMNLTRRHLSESQRAMVAARLANMGQGARTDLQPSANLPEVSQPQAAFLLNVSERLLRDAKVIIRVAPELAEEVSRGEKTVTQVLRTIKHIERSSVALPMTGRYRVIYADPPWSYSDSGLQQYGHASHHYPPMSIEELCALPVNDLAEDDAVLFLWVTSPLLEDCFAVITAWRFRYKTSFVWDKVRHNFGHYNSVRHEFLLVCTRGSCLPDVATLYDSVQSIERTETHSEKPQDFRTIIDAIYPRGARIELFARAKAAGWTTWGNE